MCMLDFLSIVYVPTVKIWSLHFSLNKSSRVFFLALFTTIGSNKTCNLVPKDPPEDVLASGPTDLKFSENV